MTLQLEKHVKYFQLCKTSMPSKAQSEAANKLALDYFVLHGLSVLNALELTAAERDDIAEYILSHRISHLQQSLPPMEGFRAGQSFVLDPQKADYDLPNLSATFFALANMLVLEKDFSQVLDRHKIMAFVARCQVTDGSSLHGSFRPVLDTHGRPWGDSDMRLCYIAAGIRKMVAYDTLEESERINDIDTKALAGFIVDKVTYSGGLSLSKHTEAHAGHTFCGLAALKLLDYDLEKAPWAPTTRDWLLHRQVDYSSSLYHGSDYAYHDEEDTGGFNGRDNKFADTCYLWWVVALLKLLGTHNTRLIDTTALTRYLLDGTQNRLLGGFGKDTQAFPDPFHSFLGLASLSLVKTTIDAATSDSMRLTELQDVDETLVITQRLRQFIDKIWSGESRNNGDTALQG